MKETDAYTRNDWVRAVNLSGFLGWTVVAVPISYGFSNGTLQNLLGVLIWAAAIGLPIAFGASWIITAPILKRVMRHKLTWLGAVFWGASISFLIALVGIAIGRLRGWIQSMNPDSFSQIGGDDKIREIDGILTVYGWFVLLQSTAIFIAEGVFIALLVRAIIGTGRDV